MEVEAKPGPARCPTGVSGLDEILRGGLPKNRLYLVTGVPGTGKTTIALQFLLEGVTRGEKGLYFTLTETHEELIEVAQSHRLSLEQISVFELSGMEQLMKEDLENTFFHPSDVELNKITTILLNEVERVKPARVVFDSLSELRLMSETTLRFRRQILHLKQFFAGRKITVLCLEDKTGEDRGLHIDSLAHGVINLAMATPEYGVTRRTLTVSKIRGVKFREGKHDFVIEQGGVVVFPRLLASQHTQDFKRESFAIGTERLDALLGGGLDRGTSAVFMGPPGSGKSSLAMRFASVAAAKGERVDCFIFDESVKTVVDRSRQLEMDLGGSIAKGLLEIHRIDSGEISPGELASRIQNAVAKQQTRMVIIDSLNGYLNAMPDERYLTLQLHELLAFRNQQGIVTLMVLAQQGLVGPMQSVIDLTYLADTVVLHRFFEAEGEIRQAISVMKKRSGNHEKTIREFKFDKNGFHIGPPLKEFHGVLTGIPIYKGSAAGVMKNPPHEIGE